VQLVSSTLASESGHLNRLAPDEFDADPHLRMELRDDQGATLAVVDGPDGPAVTSGPSPFASGKMTVQWAVNLERWRIPAPGPYLVVLTARGNELAQIEIKAEQLG
jgi:hypothetical protein